MTLEQLRIFVAVAECEHVTQGARQLNLTQSATSAAVAALEERYATKLFDRIGRRIALTEAGRLFLKEAKAVLARASAAAKVLTDLADLTRGSLALAASQTVANYWLPAAIQSYRLRYPGVIVSTTIGNSENVAAMVHEGSADLGLIEAAIDDPTLVIAPVAEDELILVAPLTHPWAARTPRSARIEARTLGVARARLRYAIGLRGCAARPWFNEQGSQRRARAPIERSRSRRSRGWRRRHRDIQVGGCEFDQGRQPRSRQISSSASPLLRPSTQGAIRQPRGAGIS
jgi:DNA-binding transcriptional LysR family regulator